MDNKKRVIVIGVAVIALIIIATGAAAAIMMEGDNYASKVDSGNRFLEAGDFSSAILAFQEAIALDADREDAYIGLYNVYAKLGYNEDARSVLERGVAATNSARLSTALEKLMAITAAAEETAAEAEKTDPATEPAKTEDKLFNPVLNQELLSFLSSANYNDYVSSYGAATSTKSGNDYNIRVGNLPAALVYRDTSSVVIIDQSKGIPYNHYQPSEIHLDNVTVLFGGSALSYTDMKNLTGVNNVSKNGDTVNFTYGNCDVTIACEDEMITEKSDNTIVLTVQQAEAEQHTLEAKVVDATNGSGVSGAKVTAYTGYGTYGKSVEKTTDSAGNAALELEESGTYTVVVEKDGYIEESFEIYVLSNETVCRKTLNISPTMSADTIRFVLTWDASPNDLDSYLIGTSSDGSYTKVSFTGMVATNSSGQTVAELDVDDMSGFGPETITLMDTAGRFEFAVADYTVSGTMSYSHATVKIYVGSSLYTTVEVPDGIGNGWSVCTVENGAISVTNTAHTSQNGTIS